MLGTIRTGHLSRKVQGQQARKNFGKSHVIQHYGTEQDVTGQSRTLQDKAWRSACSVCSVGRADRADRAGNTKAQEDLGYKDWIDFLSLLDSNSL